ncbi:hypothetical protein CTI12_AA501420 [Artemisia annua]|uniref:Uncharacterized protein n=1 Tax=Artemisia annua TaxID=35608 RepID=A0A2U1LE10_ARTAN|nr:hypothetical protein CTI12_AA501420 [Artemisia annua]
MGDIENLETKKEVHSLLMRLSGGQRYYQPKKASKDPALIKTYGVNSKGLTLVWSIDIMEEHMQTVQVLKVWDLLQGTFKLRHVIQRINMLHQAYSDETMNRCQEKDYDGNLEIPKIWSKVDENENLSSRLSAMSLTEEELSSSPSSLPGFLRGK